MTSCSRVAVAPSGRGRRRSAGRSAWPRGRAGTGRRASATTSSTATGSACGQRRRRPAAGTARSAPGPVGSAGSPRAASGRRTGAPPPGRRPRPRPPRPAATAHRPGSSARGDTLATKSRRTSSTRRGLGAVVDEHAAPGRRRAGRPAPPSDQPRAAAAAAGQLELDAAGPRRRRRTARTARTHLLVGEPAAADQAPGVRRRAGPDDRLGVVQDDRAGPQRGEDRRRRRAAAPALVGDRPGRRRRLRASGDADRQRRSARRATPTATPTTPRPATAAVVASTASMRRSTAGQRWLRTPERAADGVASCSPVCAGLVHAAADRRGRLSCPSPRQCATAPACEALACATRTTRTSTRSPTSWSR